MVIRYGLSSAISRNHSGETDGVRQKRMRGEKSRCFVCSIKMLDGELRHPPGSVLSVAELLNSLGFAVLASEWLRTRSLQRAAIGVALLLIANALSPAFALAIGCALIAYSFGARLALGTVRDASVRLGVRGGAILLLVCAALGALVAATRWHGAAASLRTTLTAFEIAALWSSKVATFAAVYFVAGYVELALFHAPQLRFRAYSAAVLGALKFVLPLYPFLVVIASTVMMFAVSIVEHTGDLGRSARIHALMNVAIYYGTFFGPFAVSYVSAKRRCIAERDSGSGGVLPR